MNPEKISPQERAKIEKERTISDAELLEGQEFFNFGKAQYEIAENGEKILREGNSKFPQWADEVESEKRSLKAREVKEVSDDSIVQSQGVAKIEEVRTISDGDLLRHGSYYEIAEDGKKILREGYNDEARNMNATRDIWNYLEENNIGIGSYVRVNSTYYKKNVPKMRGASGDWGARLDGKLVGVVYDSNNNRCCLIIECTKKGYHEGEKYIVAKEHIESIERVQV